MASSVIKSPNVYGDSRIHQTASLTHDFNVPNDSCNLFISSSTGASRLYIGVLFKAAGNITVQDIVKGSNVTTSVNGNTFTITYDISQGCDVRIVNARGDLIT